MFFIRTAFWLGIIVTVMPTDPESQQRMKLAARDGIAHVSSLCDRHQETCRHASAAWSTFKVKAEAAGRLAFGLAMEQMSGSRPQPGAATSLRPEAPQTQGTLRPDDLEPRWRGDIPRDRG